MFPPENRGVDWFYLLNGRRARNPRMKKWHLNASSTLCKSLITSLILFSSKWLLHSGTWTQQQETPGAPSLHNNPGRFISNLTHVPGPVTDCFHLYSAPIRPCTEADLLPLSTRAGFHCIYCFCGRGQLRLSNGAWVPGGSMAQQMPQEPHIKLLFQITQRHSREYLCKDSKKWGAHTLSPRGT